VSDLQWQRWMDLGGVSAWRLAGRSRRGGSTWQASVAGEVWVWLNLEGEGVIWGKEDRLFLKPGMYAIFGEDEAERWRWTRLPGAHRSELLVISRAWLARRLGERLQFVHPDFAKWIEGGGRLVFAGLMMGQERELAEALAATLAEDPAAPLRVEARVLEWAALRLFRRDRSDPGAGFCHRVGPAQVVDKALAQLRRRLDGPIDLEALGRDCGASPTHLSRLVRKRTGATLREHQRRMRIGAACELLREDGASVTDVALRVGYNSLSHFAKAFREETGRSPRDWRRVNGR